MRRRYQVTDRNGKVHKRSTEHRTYTHAIVIHFAERPPSARWPKGWPAFSRAEWAGTRTLADNVARRWTRQPSVEVEILDAQEVTK
jgi:hypothetical protein